MNCSDPARQVGVGTRIPRKRMDWDQNLPIVYLLTCSRTVQHYHSEKYGPEKKFENYNYRWVEPFARTVNPGE